MSLHTVAVWNLKSTQVTYELVLTSMSAEVFLISFLENCNPRITLKEGLYRSWCGLNTLGDSGVNTLGDTSAFGNPTVQLLLTRRGKIRMDSVDIVFEFYIALL